LLSSLNFADVIAKLRAKWEAPEGRQLKPKFYIIEKNGRFYCNACRKDYSDKNNAKKHLRSHAGETTCHICYKSFGTVPRLNYHLAMHEGKTRCPVCFKVFGCVYSLKGHLKSVHRLQ
jgi:hypothetical protein